MTSRCKTTKKVSYKSKKAAERARASLRGSHRGDADSQEVYRCRDTPSHFHLGHSGNLPQSDDEPTGVKAGRRPRWTFAEWEVATMQLWSRCRDFCECCGEPLRGAMQRHHRQVREVGGDRLANLVGLHPHCHDWVHAHPELAMPRGLIVSRHATDPADVPLTLPDGRVVLLDDDGHYVSTPDPKG